MLHLRNHRRFSIDEYLGLEENSSSKSEYCQGEIFSMSGGSLEHNRIVADVLTELNVALRGKQCQVFPSDLRLYIASKQVLTYPDIVVVCGLPQLLPGRTDTITDATLVVEVLSPSTQEYDRNGKFRIYRDLPSFSEYLLIAQDEIRVEHHRRQGPGQWLMTEHISRNAEVVLSSIEVAVSMGEIYRRIGL